MYSDLTRVPTHLVPSNSLHESEIYFRMTGGLGNQLFGLSECYQLHKLTGKRVVIDFGHVDHVKEEQTSPFNFGYSWMRQVVYLSSDNTGTVPLKNLATDIISSEDRFFTGWRPSLAVLEQSSLFKRSVLPANWSPLSKNIEEPFVGLHLRFGDYLHLPSLGGNISVDRAYVGQALNLLKSELGLRFVKVFSDNREKSIELCKPFSGFEFQVLESREPILDLVDLSRADAIVASASTFSFWAAYFSKTNSVIFPSPFFPVNPLWEKELIDKSWTQIRRTNRSSRELRKIWNFIFRKENLDFD